MNEEEIYKFGDFVITYDKGVNNDRSSLIISKVDKINIYVLGELYDESADIINTIINNLQQENQELKKQLEKRTKMYQNAYDYSQKMEGKAIILETQQKEFIEYLENEIERNRKEATCMVAYNNNVLPLKEILSKYKEIIGVSK